MRYMIKILKKEIINCRKYAQKLYRDSTEYLQEIDELTKFFLNIIKRINNVIDIQNPYKKDLEDIHDMQIIQNNVDLEKINEAN